MNSLTLQAVYILVEWSLVDNTLLIDNLTMTNSGLPLCHFVSFGNHTTSSLTSNMFDLTK